MELMMDARMLTTSIPSKPRRPGQVAPGAVQAMPM